MGHLRPGRLLPWFAKKTDQGLEENEMTSTSTIARFPILAVMLAGVTAALALALLLSTAGASANGNGAGGVTGPAFLVDGHLYRTVVTPTDLSGTGAPDHSFDIIYDLGGAQPNVAEAAPGDRDFNGGRWKVHAVSFNTSYADTLAAYDMNASGTLDSAEEIEAALADAGPSGATDLGVVAYFVCPVIEVPAAH